MIWVLEKFCHLQHSKYLYYLVDILLGGFAAEGADLIQNIQRLHGGGRV